MRLFIVIAMFMSSTVWAKKVEYRKVQEVKFDATDVDGVARNPDGSYVTQKKGMDFVPLYKVRENFDENMKESKDHLN